MKNIIIFLYFFCSASFLTAQQGTSVSGWVSDKDTGERLIGALVYDINTKTISQTDNYGFFSLKIRKDNCRIRFSYVGYLSDTLLLFTAKDTVFDVKLRPQMLQEVIVSAKSNINQQDVGVIQIPVSDLKSRPVLLGEPDIIKALALTPGVKQGTEGTTGLYVRGGTPDQNNILLDGATVYNTSHLFGFVSVFNPDAIKSVTRHYE